MKMIHLNRFGSPLWMFVGFVLLSAELSAEQPEMKLRLKDGSYSTGVLVPTNEPNRIGWQAKGFSNPFLFELDAIRSVSVAVDDAQIAGKTEDGDRRPAKETKGPDILVELSDGSAVMGQLQSLDDKQAVLQSSTLGLIRVDRDRIAALGSANFVGKVLFDGPIKPQDWSVSKPEAWDFEAGVLHAQQGNAIAIGRIGIPEMARVDLTLAWQDSPDFVLSFCTAASLRTSRVEQVSAAARLEVWDKQLALVREVDGGADIALVTDLAGSSSRISLTVYIDQRAGIVSVYDVHGRKLDAVSVKAERIVVRDAIHLVNHGNKLSLESLEVREWDGVQRDAVSNENAKVVTKDGVELGGGILNFDLEDSKWEIQLRSGDTKELPVDTLRRGDVWRLDTIKARGPVDAAADSSAEEDRAPSAESAPGEDKEDAIEGIEVVLDSRERLRGEWLPSDTNMLRLDVVGISPIDGKGDVLFPVSKVRGIVGSTNRFDFDEMKVRLGTLKTESNQLTGSLDPSNEVEESQAAICWKPIGSSTASLIQDDASGVIVYRRRLPRVKTRERNGANEIEIVDFLIGDESKPGAEVKPIPGSREIKFRTGDAISGVVRRIDEKGMVFESSQSESTFAAHKQIQEIELNPLLGDRKFSRDRLDRLMTVPRSQRGDPPTHLFLSVRGDLLRGRLLSLGEGVVELEVRLEVVKLSTEQISKIIWLHDRTWVDASEGDREGTGEDRPPFLVHAITGNGRGLTFEPVRGSKETLAGTSDLLGECMVSVNDLSRVLFGRDIEKRIVEFEEDPWILSLAQLPRVFMQSEDGDASPGSLYAGTASELVDRLAPEFSLKQLNGDLFRLKEQRGAVVVLDFWASWCGPCVQTMPLLESAVNEFGDSKVQLFAVNLQENDERIRAAAERLELQATVLKDSSGQVAAAYGATAIPQTVIIDKAGVVRHVFVGGGSKVVEQIRVALGRVLDGG